VAAAAAATSKALRYILKDSRLKADGSKRRRARPENDAVVWLKLVTGCTYIRGIDMSGEDRFPLSRVDFDHLGDFCKRGTVLFVKIRRRAPVFRLVLSLGLPFSVIFGPPNALVLLARNKTHKETAFMSRDSNLDFHAMCTQERERD